MHRRIDVGEGKLVRRNLAVGVHVPFPEQQHELVFGELRIQLRKGDHVERQVPGRIPRVLPFVGHGDHVAVIEVSPVVVAAVLPAGGRRRLRRVAFQPVRHRVMVKLLGPQQSCVCLAHDGARGIGTRQQVTVELVGLSGPPLEQCVWSVQMLLTVLRQRAQAKIHRAAFSAREIELVIGGRLGPDALRVHRLAPPPDHIIVQRILHVGRSIPQAEEPLEIGLVFGEQHLATRIEFELILSQRNVFGMDAVFGSAR